MNYIARPGIVLTKICGRYVLIPSRSAGKACKQVQPLPMLGAVVWGMVKNEEPEEKIIEILRIFKKKPDEELREEIHEICDKLYQRGFLMRRGEEK